MLAVSGSISENTGFARRYSAAFEVATNVIGDVMISSPLQGLMRSKRREALRYLRKKQHSILPPCILQWQTQTSQLPVPGSGSQISESTPPLKYHPDRLTAGYRELPYSHLHSMIKCSISSTVSHLTLLSLRYENPSDILGNLV